jgi:hypothetical protein
LQVLYPIEISSNGTHPTGNTLGAKADLAKKEAAAERK